MAAGTLVHPGRIPGRIKPPPTRRAYLVFTVPAPLERGAARPPRMPGRHPSRQQQRPRRFAYLVTPAPLPVIPPGSGVVGAATFLLGLEPGTKLTFSWQTNVVPSYAGQEQRESTGSSPRRRFTGNAFLLDGGMRDVAGQLQRTAARGSTFLLGLPMEELVVTADSLGTIVTVGDATLCDWAVLNQRCVVLGIDGSAASAIVLSATATTITIALTAANGSVNPTGVLGATGRAGARIMPLLQVLLDPAQTFARYAVTVGLWSLNAKASVFGFAGVDSMGVGALITTLTAHEPVPVATLLDNDLMIWDRVNEVAGTASESMGSRTELVDLGGVPFSIGGANVPDWQRSIKLRSTSREDWQWFKAFIRQLRGQQRPFLLSTNRPDLVFVGAVAGGIKVASSNAVGGNDYISWFASDAHKRLAIVAGGVLQYVSVTSVVDNLDGTLTVMLDSLVSGTITKISFLEQVRLNTDDIDVSFDGGQFAVELQAVTVQESVTVPKLFVFDVVFNVQPGAPLVPKTLSGAMGQTTLITYTGGSAFHIAGILNTLPAGNVDGMVVCLVDIGGHGYVLEHDTGNFTTDGLLLSAATAVGGVRFAMWFRYHGALARWVNFWSV